jgi:hypothetical protein
MVCERIAFHLYLLNPEHIILIQLITIIINNQLNTNNCRTSRVNELMKYGNFLFKIKNQKNVLKKELNKNMIKKKESTDTIAIKHKISPMKLKVPGKLRLLSKKNNNNPRNCVFTKKKQSKYLE